MIKKLIGLKLRLRRYYTLKIYAFYYCLKTIIPFPTYIHKYNLYINPYFIV